VSELISMDAYGVMTEPSTLRIQRLLPGPVERVWSYLTDSKLRRQWLAAGDMKLEAGAPLELVWRNDELTDPPGKRPQGFEDEHRMQSRITEVDPPRKLAITWGASGEVSFELEPEGKDVLLTLIHRRLPEGAARLNIAAGWHAHLDIMAAKVSGRMPEPFWESWSRLRTEYERRMPG
jgi:uncharacterized protein YndB with AHSA1/START domain